MSADGAITAVDALFILQCEVGIPNAFCPEVRAASVMNAEDAAAAAQAKQMLVEQGVWQEMNVSVFVPLITR